MKKIIYALAVVFFSSLTFISCTEEEVAPSTENGGGTANMEGIGR